MDYAHLSARMDRRSVGIITQSKSEVKCTEQMAGWRLAEARCILPQAQPHPLSGSDWRSRASCVIMGSMAHPNRLRLWLVFALIAVLAAVVSLWLCGMLAGDGAATPPASPLPGAVEGMSPLSTPAASPGESVAPRLGPGMILLWVALGCVLALAISFIIFRRYH